MLVHLINRDGVTTDITPFITNITNTGEFRSACRTTDISIIKTPYDPMISDIDANLGYDIGLIDDNNKLMFYGRIWNRGKATNSNTLNFHCKDFGIYLLKNKYNYKFRNISPEDITKKVCKDFGITIGEIASTGVTISRNFIGVTLYDIIMTSYNLSNTGEYMIRFNGRSLNVVKKGIVLARKFLAGAELLSSSVTETLDNMVNTIYVMGENDTLIDTIKNAMDVKDYGILSDILKSNKKPYKDKANNMLQGIEQKIRVTNFGDSEFITGNAVLIEETYTKVTGRFYVDSDTHTWNNGIYTNALVLNFKNIMDKKESGSEVEDSKAKKAGKTKKVKGESKIQLKYINKP